MDSTQGKDEEVERLKSLFVQLDQTRGQLMRKLNRLQEQQDSHESQVLTTHLTHAFTKI